MIKTSDLTLVKRRVMKIGELRLWKSSEGVFYVSLDNRNYHNLVELTPAQVEKWLDELTPPKSCEPA